MESYKKDQNKIVEMVVEQDLLIWKIADSLQDILKQIEKNRSKQMPK